jgi:hypothetical protein
VQPREKISFLRDLFQNFSRDPWLHSGIAHSGEPPTVLGGSPEAKKVDTDLIDGIIWYGC